MRLHRNIATLMDLGSANTDQTGNIYEVLPASEDPVHDGDHAFQVYFALTQSGGATSPTVTAKLQTSLDKVNWIDLVTSTVLNQDGSKAETKDAGTASAPMLTYVRAITLLGGDTKPTHAANVRLVSIAPFRVKKVA